MTVPEPTDVAPPHARLQPRRSRGPLPRGPARDRPLQARAAAFAFARRRPDAPWELRLPLPPVDRFEYQLQVADADGDVELDPRPGRADRVRAVRRQVRLRSRRGTRRRRGSSADVPAGHGRAARARERAAARRRCTGLLWTPAGVERRTSVPLLVAHDGPEYAEHSALLGYLAAAVAAGEAPPLRAALLAPRPRANEHYGASTRYSAALVEELLPALEPQPGPVVGVGASLGALALLHAHRGIPDAFAGLFLQSGSFFQAATDPWEEDFSALRADHPLRRPRPEGARARPADPGHDHLRHAPRRTWRTTARSGTRSRARATRSSSRSSATGTPGSAGATRSSPHLGRLLARAWR